ncbi:MAG TPA: hypothetical protein VJ792_06815 [Candidatus Nitrosotalea sp.]|nr:hypothetical protein [Candidatus Nitrosotalea sp.]
MARAWLLAIIFLAAACIAIQEDKASGYVDPSCQVSVQFTANASRAVFEGRQVMRQNPDGTYYPGDAFDFSILVSWTHNCWRIYPQNVIPSGITLSNIERGPTVRDPQGNGHFYEYGHAEIAPDAKSASVSQTVGALGLVCDISRCSKGYTSGTGSYVPSIILPKASIGISFANFTDRDGYLMRNKDGTFYAWDGINLVYSPDYQWREAREGTIIPVTEYISDLPLMGQYECHRDSCQYAFSKPAITAWSYQFSYGQGHTAFNSTAPSFDGMHVIAYHTILYNMGRKIGDGYNSTSALVVQYRPVFVSYPYVVLKDTGSWWGFGKTPAVALHYLGSLGGGKDDGPGAMHEDRRSKINAFNYSSYAYRILAKVPLNESLTWAGAYQANFTDGNFTYHDDSLKAGAGSAVFVHAGYGKILFYHPILHTILETRYDNSSLACTLKSSDFAGFTTYTLTSYLLGYPHTRFSTDVMAIALHSDGSINPIPLKISMVPERSENAIYEQDFVRQKVTHDRDRVFAGIVLGDMYGKNDTIHGMGLANMRANLTSMAIPDVYRAFAQDPLDLPLNIVYEQPSPYNVTISAGNRTISFLERGFEFDTSWKYVINVDRDNPLNASRYNNLVTIFPDKNFGPYAHVFVDSREQNVACGSGCTIFLDGQEGNATVQASNPWGGTALRIFPGERQSPTLPHYNISSAATAFFVAAICFFVIKFFGRSIANAFGFGQ